MNSPTGRRRWQRSAGRRRAEALPILKSPKLYSTCARGRPVSGSWTLWASRGYGMTLEVTVRRCIAPAGQHATGYVHTLYPIALAYALAEFLWGYGPQTRITTWGQGAVVAACLQCQSGGGPSHQS